MINIDEVIYGLEFTKAMITFNPSTGEDIEPEDLNEDNKITYDACVGAITILKEREPKTPIHIHEEYPEHNWETDEDGKIDEWVMDYEYHNGPGCKRCGYSFCIHCKPNGWNDRPCIVDFYKCPECGERIFKHGKNIEHCINCGQAVKWNEID